MLDTLIKNFKENYLLLAYHAALPLVLTPELIGYLRSTFLHDEVPWVAEIDLLLSDLCRPIGYEQYVILPSIRDQLLKNARVFLGDERMEEVAYLLIHYIEDLSTNKISISKNEIQTQRWSALIYINEHREQAVKEIAECLFEQLNTKYNVVNPTINDTSTNFDLREINRLVKVTEALSPELKKYPELVDYATKISSVLTSISRMN